jgi:3-hydroxy-9,10-secoandrosta-1,3,5(10)-triene-9,17-dione monooxygenase reductase component
MPAHLDPKAYRSALGTFATGVTVITARDADGNPAGLTANSFNSVSLDPPMVLWSLGRQSRSLPVFRDAGHWAVHVLAADQGALSDRFARSGSDKFAGLAFADNGHGVPLLAGCAARFECRASFQYDGGDHLIFVGEVTAFEHAERPPLVFHAGRYARATRHDRTLPPARSARIAGGLGEDLLGYLLGRAHFQSHLGLRTLVRAQGLSEAQWVVLAALTAQDGVSAAALDAALSYVLDQDAEPLLLQLVKAGWVQAQGPLFRLTPAGRDRSLHLLAAAKAIESRLVQSLGEEDGLLLKTLLRRLILATDPGLPDLWPALESAA